MNWSNSMTGLFFSLQHDHDLSPSWNTGPPGWYEQSPSGFDAGSYSFPQPLCVQRAIVSGVSGGVGGIDFDHGDGPRKWRWTAPTSTFLGWRFLEAEGTRVPFACVSHGIDVEAMQTVVGFLLPLSVSSGGGGSWRVGGVGGGGGGGLAGGVVAATSR